MIQTRRATVIVRTAFAAMVGVCLWNPTSAEAQSLAIEPKDTVRARGKVDDTGPWLGYVKITTNTSASAKPITLSVGDLTCDGGRPQIGSALIGIADANIQTQPGKSVQVGIRVAGPHSPARCVGTATLAAGADSTRIVLVAQPLPAIKPWNSGESLRFGLVRCASRVTCWFAGKLLNGPALSASRDIPLSNPAHFNPGGVHAVASGQGQRWPGTGDSSTLSVESTPTRGSREGQLPILTLRVVADATALRPDKYSGQALIAFESYDDVISLPYEITVRDGPFPAVLVMIVGVLIGVLRKATDDNKKQLDSLDRLNAAKTAMGSLPEQYQRAIHVQLETIEDAIYRGQLAVTDREIPLVENRLGELRALYILEQEGRAITNDEKQLAPLLVAIRQALNAIALHDEGDEARQRTAAEKALVELQSNVRADQLSLPGVAINAGDTLPPQWWKWWSGGLQGHLALLAQGRKWLYALTLLVVGFAGIKAFYIDNATFGASGLPDYVALLIWGFSTDATGRTLADAGHAVTRT